MTPSIKHVPNVYYNETSNRKKISTIDGKSEETILMSENGSSDRDEEFEHLDEEFEALVRERSLIQETASFPRRVSAADSAPNLFSLSRGSDKDRSYWLGQEEPNMSPTLTASDDPLV